MNDKLTPFHLAIPVSDLDESILFYRDILELDLGRRSDRWADFNFFGHQLVCHVSLQINKQQTNPVDGENVPIPHFGVVVSIEKFKELVSKLKGKEIDFIIKPTVRFSGQIGEQRIMFFKDPSGNAIEIKAFKDINNLFKV